MTTYLVATASVHVTAAAADYLDERLDPAADAVVVVAVREPDAPDRDAGDAANVARSRLAAVTPVVDTREGDAVDELLGAVAAHDPDEVVIGPHDGAADSSGLGSTARALLERLDRPVAVVPLTGE